MIRLTTPRGTVGSLRFTATGHLLGVGFTVSMYGPERAVWWDPTAGRAVRLATGLKFGLSPDGRFLLRWRPGGAILVADAAGERRPVRVPAPGGWPPHGSLAAAPAGDELAVSAPDCHWFCPLPAGPAVRRRGHAPGLAYSPGGRWVYTGSLGYLGRTVRLWDRAAGHRLVRLPACAGAMMAVGPDDRTAAVTRSRGRTVAVWDMPAGREVARLSHPAPVTAVGVGPDSERVLTGDAAGTVRVWGVGTGRVEAGYAAGVEAVRAVAVAPDGLTAAAGGLRGVVVWDL